MQSLTGKITGDSLTATEWNQLPQEVQNVITALGQTLGSGDLNQLGKSIAGYVANGTFYTDSGAADAYALGVVGSKQAPTAYTDGFSAVFRAGNTNTGASTVNVAGLGSKSIKTVAGADLAAGDITTGDYVTLRYDLASGWFDVVSLQESPQIGQVNNAIINGGCLVGQRASPSLTTSYQYGKVDRIAVKADGTVGAGTVTQVETALLGSSGFACHASGVTLTGAGAIYYRYRIESKDVQRFISDKGIFQCQAYHDVGSAVDYTITINKANAQDDFSTITQIATSAAPISVANITDTQMSLAVADMGACGNGVEIVVKADCGAVTTKNFYLTELQMTVDDAVSNFNHRSISEELILCRRYYEKSYNNSIDPGTAGENGACFDEGDGGTMRSTCKLIPKRSAPTVVVYSTLNGASGFITNRDTSTNLAASVLGIGENNFTISAATTSAAFTYSWHFTANAEL